MDRRSAAPEPDEPDAIDGEAGAPDAAPEPDPSPDAVGDAASDGDGVDERESAYALLQRGQALAGGRHYAQAAIVLERAARLEPNRGSILEALGRAYFNSGQHEPARQTFEALLEVDPSADYAHYGLGQALKRLGRSAEARTHLRMAVALAPGSKLYRGALNRLGPPPASKPEASPEADPSAD